MQELGQGGAKNVIKPTAAGQIPIAGTQNGRFVYIPTLNPIPVPTASDVGKAPVVSGFDATTGVPLYTYAPVIPEDEIAKSLFNQNGIAKNPSGSISADKKNIIITPFSAVFYDPVLQVRSTIDKTTNSTVPVNATASQQITYIYIKPDGTFGLDYTLVDNRVYMFEVITSSTTPFDIISFKPIYVIYSNIQSTIRNFANAMGLSANDFAMSYSVTTNRISQSSSTARLAGYNINQTSANSSVRPFAISTAITFDYFAFTVADRVPGTQIVVRQYKIDSPTTATSTNITGNNFGIVLIYAGIDGSYKALAPQLSYTSEANARQSVLTYLQTVRVPKDIAELYSPIAALYVPGNIQNNTALNIDVISGIGLGGAPLQDSAVLPPPTVAGTVKVPPGLNQYVIDQTSGSAPTIDTTGATNGQILTFESTVLKFSDPQVVLPGRYFAEQKVDSLKIAGDGTILSPGYDVGGKKGDFAGLGLTFTVAVVDAAKKINSLTINGNPKLMIMGGLYVNNQGGAKFGTDGRTTIYYINDLLNPYPVGPNNPQGKPGLDFSIFFLLGV